MDEQNTVVTNNTLFANRTRVNDIQYELGRNDPARGTRVNRPARERADGYEARNDYAPENAYAPQIETIHWYSQYDSYLEQEIKDLRRYVDSLGNRIVELESLVLNSLKEIAALKDSVGFKYFEWDDYDG